MSIELKSACSRKVLAVQCIACTLQIYFAKLNKGSFSNKSFFLYSRTENVDFTSASLSPNECNQVLRVTIYVLSAKRTIFSQVGIAKQNALIL